MCNGSLNTAQLCPCFDFRAVTLVVTVFLGLRPRWTELLWYSFTPKGVLHQQDPCWTSCPCIFQWGRISEDEWHLVVSYSWGSLFLGAQELPSLVGRLNLVTTYSERRRNSFARCYKRSCKAITVICLLTLETFLPEYEYHYSLDGNNKFVLFHDLGPI